MAEIRTQVNVDQVPHFPIPSRRPRSLVESLTREVERLTEDNKQLRAAVEIYREVLCRCTGHATPQG